MISTRLKSLESRAAYRSRKACQQPVLDESSCAHGTQELFFWASGLIKEVKSRFRHFTSSTDFAFATMPNWLRYVLSLRNELHNDVARFDIARNRSSEYRRLLAAKERPGLVRAREREDSDEDLALELQLRAMALDAYDACLDRLEAAGADFTAEFVGVARDELGNASRTVAGWDDSVSPPPDSDILFTIDVAGLPWTFGALDVLNRRTRHFLARCGLVNHAAKSYAKLKCMDLRAIEALYECSLDARRRGGKTAEQPLYWEFFTEARTARALREHLEAVARVLAAGGGGGHFRPDVSSFAFPSPAHDSCFSRVRFRLRTAGLGLLLVLRLAPLRRPPPARC
jgi:hypothetical protein